MASNVTEEMITEAVEMARLVMDRCGFKIRNMESPGTLHKEKHADVTATILAAMIMAGGNPTNGE